ncbi:MAG: SPOR domain-containing protein [Bacteroidales bacterium]|nr:SPOR domain-containing protein [Bacteroidales bacterium]
MFTPAIKCLFCAAGLLVLLSGPMLFGQEMNQELNKVQQQSMASFEEGNFRSALSGFRILMDRDPENAMHSYYAGICLVELNEQLDEAIELLYGASNRGVPGNVNYYLGSAYHQDYNFMDAQKFFGRFELEATRQELKEYNLKHLISTCRSAREITATYNPYEVLNVTFIDLHDSLQFTQVKMKGGQLQRKPTEYFRANEDRSGLNSLMFMPGNPVRGDFFYYTGYSRNGKGGSQLFRVKKGSGRSWGDPEEVRDLNTEGDEIMPYFDPIENDLYFASDGRQGIGGFDLYRSHYDSERDEWSEPMNLGFPINSVMDEYLLLPGSDLGMVMFFSTRQGTDSTVTVYRVHLIEPKKKTVANDTRMLKEIAYLGGVAAEILADMESLSVKNHPSVSEERPVTDTKNQVNTDRPQITPVTILPESGAKTAYQITLAEALKHQSVSDSLKDLATSARVKVRESDDPNDRWVWQKQIMVWEKKARDEEALADGLYAQLEDGKAGHPPPSKMDVPETIQVDMVVGDITVYRYSDNVIGIEGEPGNEERHGSVSRVVESKAPSVEKEPVVSPPPHINRFDILGKSPYSISKPIPLDVSLPAGTFYRIQIGVFSTEVEPDAFQGISPITGERIRDRGLFKYYAGKFSRYDDAFSVISMVRSRGYEDAFIVAWYNGTTVSTQKAKQLE